MTTIAFDGKVLACDSCWADKEVQVIRRTKILRLNGGLLYGAAGSSDDRELLEMLHKVKKPAQLPSLAALGTIRQDLTALVIFPDKRAFVLDTCHVSPGEPEAQECGCTEYDVPCAVGSGFVPALAAMRGGASAYDGVMIACDLDLNSKRPVYQLTLQPRHRPVVKKGKK